MNTVKLYGALGQEFGTEHRFQIASPVEAMQALAANFPKILNALRGGFYRLVVGKRASTGTALDETTILTRPLGNETLHIIPVVKGRGKGGLGKVLAGILLIGLAAFGGPLMATGIGAGGTLTVGSIVGQIGMGLALTGVASLLAPEQDGGDKQKSFTLAGPQVTLREGGIIPTAYGEVWTGGTMISGALNVQNSQ